MASVQSDNGWTKTELGDGWVKLTEVCDAFTTGGTDGRQDQIITESGLEISLPETHCLLKFS